MRVAITGANSGIGLRAARLLAAEGHEVLALCRSLERAEAALGGTPGVTIERLDLADPASLRVAADRITAAGPLDALVHNAAVFDQTARVAELTAEGRERVWATDHLGPLELTARLSGALAASPAPRVLFVASKGLLASPRIRIRWEALDGHGWYTPTRAYYHAKLAQVMTAMSLAERLGDRLAVRCLRVPAVRLDPARLAAQPALLRALYAPKNRAAASPEEIAAVYRDLLLDARPTPADEVYVEERRRVVAVPRFARDRAHRDRLWQLSLTELGEPAWAWPELARSGPAER